MKQAIACCCLLICCLLIISSCQTQSTETEKQVHPDKKEVAVKDENDLKAWERVILPIPKINPDEISFFDELIKFCNYKYYGEFVYPQKSKLPYESTYLAVDFESCEDSLILMKLDFNMPELHTVIIWRLMETDNGLLFKHDIRGKDGKLAPNSMYGGFNFQKANSLTQSFQPDDFTLQKYGKTMTDHSWWISLNDTKDILIYSLKVKEEIVMQAQINLLEILDH